MGAIQTLQQFVLRLPYDPPSRFVTQSITTTSHSAGLSCTLIELCTISLRQTKEHVYCTIMAAHRGPLAGHTFAPRLPIQIANLKIVVFRICLLLLCAACTRGIVHRVPYTRTSGKLSLHGMQAAAVYSASHARFESPGGSRVGIRGDVLAQTPPMG